MTTTPETLLPCPFKSGAYQNLIENQQQLDQEGIIVGVSRQALDYCLDWMRTRHPVPVASAKADIGEMLHQIREYFDQRADRDYDGTPDKVATLLQHTVDIMRQLDIEKEID